MTLQTRGLLVLVTLLVGCGIQRDHGLGWPGVHAKGITLFGGPLRYSRIGWGGQLGVGPPPRSPSGCRAGGSSSPTSSQSPSSNPMERQSGNPAAAGDRFLESVPLAGKSNPVLGRPTQASTSRIDCRISASAHIRARGPSLWGIEVDDG